MAKYCGNCGNQLNDNDVFCAKCGTSQTQQQTNQQAQPNNGGQQYAPYTEQKSKLVAGLLQLFLGSFGAGRFYLGYTGMAIGQIAATWCTCGLGALWPIIDGILILAGNVKTDAHGVPLKD